MLKIRLARVGKKKRPAYRFIVSESARDTYGKALEILGHYNPFTKVTEVKKERILHWVSKGAQLSPTVHNMLIDQNVIKAEKIKASKSKKKGAEAQNPEAPASVATSAPETPAVEKPAEPAPVTEAVAPEAKAEKKEEKSEAPAVEEQKAEEPTPAQ